MIGREVLPSLAKNTVSTLFISFHCFPEYVKHYLLECFRRGEMDWVRRQGLKGLKNTVNYHPVSAKDSVIASDTFFFNEREEINWKTCPPLLAEVSLSTYFSFNCRYRFVTRINSLISIGQIGIQHLTELATPRPPPTA